MKTVRGLGAMLVALIAFVALSGSAQAVEPSEILPDSALETRARSISTNLRCLVCQNQSIDDSDAPLARDLRILVRDRLKAGDSDAEVVDFVVSRYGEFVLLKPRLNWSTALLWAGPFLVLLLASAALWRTIGRRGKEVQPAARALTAAEKRELKKLIDKD
jgi:cytochrome c-type biogenesis protein CcmH